MRAMMKKYKLLMLLVVIGVIFTACTKINFSFQDKNWEVLSVEITENSNGMKRTLNDFESDEVLKKLYDLEFQRARASKQNEDAKFILNLNIIDSSNEGETIDIISEDTISYEGDIYKASNGTFDLEFLQDLFCVESKYNDVNSLEGITLTTEQEIYANEVESIKLEFNNKRSNQFTFGKEINLEVEEDGIWYQVFPSGDLAWNDIGIILNGNSTMEEVISLSAYNNYLMNGHYRFVKSVYMQEEEKTSAYVLAAEFYVKGEVTGDENAEVENAKEENTKENIKGEVAEEENIKDKSIEKNTNEKNTEEVKENLDKQSEDFYLELDSNEYIYDLSLDSQEIFYTVYNNTGKTASYVAVPKLERKTENGWEEVNCTTGFCGTPDSLEDKRRGSIDLSWFSDLTEGNYRLSYNVNKSSYKSVTVSDEFTLKTKLNNETIIDESDRNKIKFAKPVIYLYPETEMNIQVKLDLKGELFVSYPDYVDGWKVTAKPDGTIMNSRDGLEYSYLFWEAITQNEFDMSKGFVVSGKDTKDFLQEKLSYLGLTPKEYNEFIVYWLPLMQNNAYNLITFQDKSYTDSAKLSISPEPDSILRVFMVYKPLNHWIDIEEQELQTFERTGFSVIEWGGTQID